MAETTTLKQQVKELMVENLMMQVDAESIDDQQPLFGPGGLGLDSVDALQLVVALEKQFGVKIPDANAAQEILRNVDSIVDAINNPPNGGG
ncbi:MAG: acyl carrier protein [Verrucomicrobia bacterium]|nr:acyl carrier protein [Verrucomicrobiota bacterium]